MSGRADIDERLLDEAIAWHHALAQDDADWEAYAEWLEADPRHREAYDEIALLDRAVDDHAPMLRRLAEPAAEPEQIVRRGRRPLLYGALAASLAVAIAVPTLRPTPDATYVTGAHESRRIALGNGIAVELAPSSRLVAESGNAAKLELASGEAYFDVAHDPSRTLAIRAGDFRVTDIGTRFALSTSGEAVSVAVAEGNVSIGADDGAPTRVAAGEQLVATTRDHNARKFAIARKDVGAWRDGRLVYNQAPLSVVASDLSRYSGKRIIVDPALVDRQFSGVLVIGDGSKLVDALSGLMAISSETRGGVVRLVGHPAR